MPDFDAFERCVKDAMLEGAAGIDACAGCIGGLPQANIPKLFKGRTHEEIGDWLHKAHGSLRTLFAPKRPRFTSSDDNREGADLFEEHTQRRIELKTGAVTDANAGLSTIAWTLTGDVGTLRRIMADSAVLRRELFMANDMEAIAASKEATTTALREYFASRLTVDRSAPSRLQHYIRCVAHGVTTLKECQSLYGIPESEWDKRLILHASWEHGWSSFSRPLGAQEDIRVHRIHVDARLTVEMRGSASGGTAIVYPHYKNSFKDARGTVPAEHWVRNPCFHVWLR